MKIENETTHLGVCEASKLASDNTEENIPSQHHYSHSVQTVNKPGMVVRSRGRKSSELEASLIYVASSRLARAQGYLVSLFLSPPPISLSLPPLSKNKTKQLHLP